MMMFGQDLDEAVKIPSIPSAFSFEKYGEIPIGHATGTANVSVPIYSIKHKDFEFPLSLSYHTSGVKVEENNPDIGMGWNLNFGGMISCTVNDLYDFTPNIGVGEDQSAMNEMYENYFNAFAYNGSGGASGVPLGTGGDLKELLATPTIATMLTFSRGYNFGQDTFYNLLDGAPDTFSYYFTGNSGKFMYNQLRKPHTIPYASVKIEEIPGTSNGEGTIEGFVLTDEQGVQFVFRALEYIVSHSTTLDLSYSLINSGGPVKNKNWRISKIILTDGEEINFEYDEISYSYKSHSSIKHEFILPRYRNHPYGLSDNLQQVEFIMNVSGKRLKRITTTFDNQSVLFSYEFTTGTPLGELSPLSKVTIFNRDIMVKEVDFSHSFSSSQRFFLNSVQELGKPAYLFEYNGGGLPSINSKAKDLWGYQSSTNQPIGQDIAGDFAYSGGTRIPDLYSTKKGSLKKINYPTGGSTEFVYELNEYEGTEKRFNKLIGGNVTFNDSHLFNTVTSAPFTISNSGVMVIEGKIEHLGNTGPSGFVPPGTIIEIKKNTTNEVVKTMHFTGDNISWPFFVSEEEYINAGTYVLSVQNFVDGIGGSFQVSWNSVYEYTGTLTGGGLRIKELINKTEGNNVSLRKQFKYTDPSNVNVSSGYLSGKIETIKAVEHHYLDPSSLTHNVQEVLKRSSNSYYNVGNVFYENVTVLEEDSKTIHKFTKFKDQFKTVDWETGPTIDYSWLRNIPLKKEIFKRINNVDVPVQTTVYDYANLNYIPIPFSTYYNDNVNTYKESLIGFVVRLRTPEIYSTTSLLSPANYTMIPYHVPTNWIYKTKETNILYDLNGANPTTSVNNYFYDNSAHLQLTRVEMTNSKGEFFKTKTYYPSDVNFNNDLGHENLTIIEKQAIDNLKTQHRISTPVQVESYKNSVLLSTKRTNYHQTIDGLTLPKDMQTAKKSEILKDNIVFHSYYANGNVKELSKKEGTHVYYIWGYNDTQPIAKIENFTVANLRAVQSFITAAVNASNFDTDNCRTVSCKEEELRIALTALRNALPDDATMSSYTYDPLIGVTSMTDARGQTIYYYYDSFNRLQYVKDAEDNILSNNEYHYKN